MFNNEELQTTVPSPNRGNIREELLNLRFQRRQIQSAIAALENVRRLSTARAKLTRGLQTSTATPAQRREVA
jgi:ribosomal protein L29